MLLKVKTNWCAFYKLVLDGLCLFELGYFLYLNYIFGLSTPSLSFHSWSQARVKKENCIRSSATNIKLVVILIMHTFDL